MRLKYFLRGLGSGIIFTTIIMLVAYMTSGGYKLSDKEIINRAKNLGMVMADTPSEASSGDADREAAEEDKSTEARTTQDFTTTGEPAPTTVKPESSTENTEQEKFTATEEKTDDYTTVRITVESGMGSEEVAVLLKDAGIISDAADFDSYLNDNGYSTMIEVGTFQINSNMTYQEIAELLCKKSN